MAFGTLDRGGGDFYETPKTESDNDVTVKKKKKKKKLGTVHLAYASTLYLSCFEVFSLGENDRYEGDSGDREPKGVRAHRVLASIQSKRSTKSFQLISKAGNSTSRVSILVSQ